MKYVTIEEFEKIRLERSGDRIVIHLYGPAGESLELNTRLFLDFDVPATRIYHTEKGDVPVKDGLGATQRRGELRKYLQFYDQVTRECHGCGRRAW